MERAAFLKHIPRGEAIARTVFATSVALSPVTPNGLPLEQSCGQKVAEYQATHPSTPAEIGFTFSKKAAVWHGYEPLEALEEFLQMGFTTVQLATYMDQPTDAMIEELSAQIAIAEKHNVSVILSIGRKAPYHPEWYGDREDESDEIEKALAVLQQFGDHPAVDILKLSNEPFEDTNIAVKTSVLDPIYAEMLKYKKRYDKKIMVNHLIDLFSFDEDDFRKAAKYADIIALNDFPQVSIFHDTCEEHVRRYQQYRELADELGVELWITESQTQPWPATIPRTDIVIPTWLYDEFQPEDIATLRAMQDMYLRPDGVLFWEVMKAKKRAENGDPRSLRAIEQQIIYMNSETQEVFAIEE